MINTILIKDYSEGDRVPELLVDRQNQPWSTDSWDGISPVPVTVSAPTGNSNWVRGSDSHFQDDIHHYLHMD